VTRRLADHRAINTQGRGSEQTLLDPGAGRMAKLSADHGQKRELGDVTIIRGT
jgi:hypothetical protein